MKEIKLQKKEYKGIGYLHFFKNAITGEEKIIECTKKEYEDLATARPEQNPKLEGYVWTHSAGGTIKVDNEDTLLKENEYCDFENGYFVIAKNADGKLVGEKLLKDDIKNDFLSISKLK